MTVFKAVAEVSANIFEAVVVWSSVFSCINLFSFLLALVTYFQQYLSFKRVVHYFLKV